MKKIISISIVLLLLLSAFPLTAFAAYTVPIEIVWNDEDDKYHNRPTSVELEFFNNGPNGEDVYLMSQYITGSADSDVWTANMTFPTGFQCDSYNLKDVGGYNEYYDVKDDAQQTIVITMTNREVDFNVMVIWNDNNNEHGDRPSTLYLEAVNYYDNHRVIDSRTENVPSTGTSQNFGTFTFPARYYQTSVGTSINVQVFDNYESSLSLNADTNTYIITYTRKEENTTVFSIKWDDRDNIYQNRPTGSLFVGWGPSGDNTVTSAYVELNADNGWSGNLPESPDPSYVLKYNDFGTYRYSSELQGSFEEGYTLTYKLFLKEVDVTATWAGDEGVTAYRQPITATFKIYPTEDSEGIVVDTITADPITTGSTQSLGTMSFPFYYQGKLLYSYGASANRIPGYTMNHSLDGELTTDLSYNLTYTYNTPGSVTLTYDAGEGKFMSNDSNTLSQTKNIPEGSNLAEFEIISEKPVREGYIFKGWSTYDGTPIDSNVTDLAISTNTKVFAIWEEGKVIKAEVSPAEGGTVTGGGTYENNAQVTLRAEAFIGYRFVGWTVDGKLVETNTEYTFNATENVTVVAEFEAIPKYTVTATANPTEGGNVTGGGEYTENTQVTLTAKANTGYVFKGWSVDGNIVETATEYTFNVTKDITVVAEFETTPTFDITVTPSPADGGNVTGGGKYTENTQAKLTAEANTGYIFKGWSVDGNIVETATEYTFNVTDNITVVAEFEEKNYSVTVTSDNESQGTVAGGGTYGANENVTVTATSKDGYKFVRWTENGNVVSTNAEYTFKVTGNRSLVAVFANKDIIIQTFGDFTVSGKDLTGISFDYDQNILKINSAAPVTISNTNPSVATAHRIRIGSGNDANITLAGVNINNNYREAIVGDNNRYNTINITLVGNNNLVGVIAAIYSTGSIFIDGTGTLTATATTFNAFTSSMSNITIMGGTIYATGNNYGIFSKSVTINGDAFVKVSGNKGNIVSDNSTTRTKGVVFEGNTGVAYGSPTVISNETVPAGDTLTVPKGSTLTIPEGVTLTNNGTIIVKGDLVIEGKIDGSGEILYWSAITTESLANGKVDEEYSQTLTCAVEDTTWSIMQGALPAGLTLNSETGEISGTPTAAGEAFTFTVVAENAAGKDEMEFTIAIEKATPTVITEPTASRVIIGNALSTSILTGGETSVKGSYAWENGDEILNTKETAERTVIFTPDDTANYNAVEFTVDVTVVICDTEDGEHEYAATFDEAAHWMQCEVCQATAEEAPHTMDATHDEAEHWEYCTGCAYETEKEAHGGVANCTQHAHCDVCDIDYGELDPDNHNIPMDWINSEHSHYRECTRCGYHYLEMSHSYVDGYCCVCGDWQKLLGDANLDGKVTVKDATLIQKHIAELKTLSGDALICADVNGDGEIAVTDATLIQKWIVQLDVSEPIGKPM